MYLGHLFLFDISICTEIQHQLVKSASTMKMCIHYLLGGCKFVITLKFALIIPLSCKAKLYFCSMENGHANINFMLYLCHLFVTCVIIVFSIWRLASVLCPWPQALASSLLVPAAGPSRWPLASNLEPSLSQLLGARDQATTQETLWTQSQGFNWELFRTHPNIHHFFINYRHDRDRGLSGSGW